MYLNTYRITHKGLDRKDDMKLLKCDDPKHEYTETWKQREAVNLQFLSVFLKIFNFEKQIVKNKNLDRKVVIKLLI